MADFGGRIKLEGASEYRSALKEIGSELRLLSKEMEANGKSAEALSARVEAYKKKIEEQQKYIESIEKALEKAKAEYGENSKEVEKWQTKLNGAKATLIDMEKELKGAEKDLSEFTDKFRAAAEKMQAVGGKITDVGRSLSGLSTAAGGALAAVTALGIKSAASADDLNTLSTVTGVSTEELQKFAYASDLIDVSTETFTGALRKLTKNMESAKDGAKAQKEAFDELGVSIEENGQLRDNVDVFYELIDALGAVKNETHADALAMDIFGKSAQDLNPLISVGSDELRRLGKEAEDAGLILSEETLADMNDLNDAVDRLKATFAGNMAKVGAELAPVLQPIVEDLTAALGKLIDKLSQLDQKTIENGLKIVAFTAVLSPLLITVGNTITAIGTMITTVQNLGTAITALVAANPALLALVAALSAVTLAAAAFKHAAEEDAAAVSEFSEKNDELYRKMTEQEQAYQSEKKAIEDDTKAKLDQAEAVKGLLPRLDELTAKTERTEAEQKELEKIVGELNEAVPDLELSYDGVTGALSRNTAEIRRNIEAYEDRIRMLETEKKLETAIERKIEAETNYNEAVKKWGNVKVETGTEGGMGLGAEEEIRKKANAIITTAELEYKNAAAEVDVLSGELDKLVSGMGDSKLAPQTSAAGNGRKQETKSAEDKERMEKVDRGIKTWKYRRDKGEISESEYYDELERIRDEHFAKGSEEWQKYDLEIYNGRKKLAENAAKQAAADEKERQSAVAAARKKEFDDLKSRFERGIINEAEYYKQLESLRDRFFAAGSEEWQKYDLEIYKYRKKAEEDFYKESLESQKKAYAAQQEASYAWIKERVYRDDFADFETTAAESYERVWKRAMDAYEQGVIGDNDIAAEADKIAAAKLDDYRTEKTKFQNFIEDRNFYGDWESFNTTQEKVLKKMLENADRYYADGILGYKDYLEDVRQLNKQIYTVQAAEEESIMQTAQERIEKQLSEKKSEMDEKIAALNKEVDDLREKHTAENRARELSELNSEIKDFSSAVTISGQEHYKDLVEQRDKLLQEQEEAELAKKNSEIIAKLQEEYSQMEAEKVSLLEKIEKNTQAAAVDGEYAAFVEGLSGAVAAAAVTAVTKMTQNNTNITNNSNATQNIYPTDGVDLDAAVAAFLRKVG